MSQAKNLQLTVLAGVVVVLLGVIVVLLIRNEGERTRETIRQVAKESREEVTKAATEGVQDAVRAGVDEAGEAVAKLPRNVLEDLFEIVRDKSPKTATQPDEPPGARNQATQTDAAQTERNRPKESGKAGEAGENEIESNDGNKTDLSPQSVLTDLFQRGRRVINEIDDAVQDVIELTPMEESKAGRRFHEYLAGQQQFLELPDGQERLEELARPLLRMRDRSEIDYTISMIDSPEVNAFALPGGYVYVHKGLIDFVNSDAELQFVLAHEIAHVDLKHCARNFTYAVRAGEVGGAASEKAVSKMYHLYELQFNEELEFAADEYALARLHRLGRSRDEILAFHRRFTEYLKRKGVETAEQKPTNAAEAVSLEIENHFRSHPPNEERTRRLEEMTLPPETAAGDQAER
jgi:hypothetical protein